MSVINLKWWLGAVLLLCLVPSSFAVEQDHYNHEKRRVSRQMPEGGSATLYLLEGGITCLVAMFVRSRAVKGATHR
ncbi:MAG: hypothetical protein ABSD75_05850 [Terriglobales bacterium]